MKVGLVRSVLLLNSLCTVHSAGVPTDMRG
jgi:hypothetical protein